MKKCRCKLDGKEFNDTTNASGALISHLQKNYPDIEIPSKWKRAKVFKETGHYWHEQYFEIFEIEDKIKRTERVFDEVAICKDYIEGAGIYDLCAKYQIGKIRVKEILARNNVPLKTVGAQKTRTYNFEYTENKYNETEEYSYIAICKKTGVQFDDYKNKSGVLTIYVRDVLCESVPTAFKGMQDFRETGNYWYEEYFEIKKIAPPKRIMKKCPFCDWSFQDKESNYAEFRNHLLTEHHYTEEMYLSKFPEDRRFFPKYISTEERKKLMNDPNNYVVCPICGDKLLVLGSHIRHKHHMSVTEFKEKYPDTQLSSSYMDKKLKEQIYSYRKNAKEPVYIQSSSENNIRVQLENLGIHTKNDWNLLDGKEIDVLIPSKKLGIEFDGLKWHSNIYAGKTLGYHLDKTDRLENQGYGLIHIFSDEYMINKSAVFCEILRRIGYTEKMEHYQYNKCTISETSEELASSFIRRNSFELFNKEANKYLFISHRKRIIGCVTLTINNDYCIIHNYVLRLGVYIENWIQAFIDYLKSMNMKKIIVYADRRWISRSNNIFLNCGFKETNILSPKWHYFTSTQNSSIRHPYNEVKALCPNVDLSKEELDEYEKEELVSQNFDRVADVGSIRYELQFS